MTSTYNLATASIVVVGGVIALSAAMPSNPIDLTQTFGDIFNAVALALVLLLLLLGSTGALSLLKGGGY